MAGDWVKMRCDLSTDPSVIGIAARTGLDEDAVVGKLHRIWSWANMQLRDGFARGLTEEWIDRFLKAEGFAAAMVSVEWLRIRSDGIEIPNFERHNGDTAKSRAATADRVRRHRERQQSGQSEPDSDRITSPIRRHVLKRDNYTCGYCGWHMPSNRRAKWRFDLISLDHIIPSSRGGPSEASNLVTACLRCNAMKNDRTPDEAELVLSFLSAEALAELEAHKRYIVVTEPLPEKRREENNHPPNPPPGGAERGGKKSRERGNALDGFDPTFDAWWKEYPKKVGEVAARRAWDALSPSDQLAREMLTSLRKQIASGQYSDKKYWKDPAKWIEGGHWKDELIGSEASTPTETKAERDRRILAEREEHERRSAEARRVAADLKKKGIDLEGMTSGVGHANKRR